MTYTNFKKDLIVGNEGEWNIANFFKGYGFKNIKYNNDYRWDICITDTSNNKVSYFEIKTDVYKIDTGNMAIEIRYRGRPSGISKTKAEYFIYYYRDSGNMYVIKCDELKDLIKQNIEKLKVVMGGDDNQSELVLIDREQYADYFTKFHHEYEQKDKKCDSIQKRK